MTKRKSHIEKFTYPPTVAWLLLNGCQSLKDASTLLEAICSCGIEGIKSDEQGIKRIIEQINKESK